MTTTPGDSPTPGGSARSPRAGFILNVWLLISLALLLAVAVQRDYILGMYCEFLEVDRVDCIVAGIIGALGVAACLGGAMHFIDRTVQVGIAWPWRWLLLLQKRLLMIGQLAVVAVAVYAASLMIFHRPIPGFIPDGPEEAGAFVG